MANDINEAANEIRDALLGDKIVVDGEKREILDVSGMVYDYHSDGLVPKREHPDWQDGGLNPTEVGIHVEGEGWLTAEDYKAKLVSGEWGVAQ